jgi:hypothetical protein
MSRSRDIVRFSAAVGASFLVLLAFLAGSVSSQETDWVSV